MWVTGQGTLGNAEPDASPAVAAPRAEPDPSHPLGPWPRARDPAVKTVITPGRRASDLRRGADGTLC